MKNKNQIEYFCNTDYNETYKKLIPNTIFDKDKIYLSKIVYFKSIDKLNEYIENIYSLTALQIFQTTEQFFITEDELKKLNLHFFKDTNQKITSYKIFKNNLGNFI